MPKKKVKVNDKFFEDNHIDKECKFIYSFLYTKGFEKNSIPFQYWRNTTRIPYNKCRI